VQLRRDVVAVSEIDSIIEEIQTVSRNLRNRSTEGAGRAILAVMLRLAWRVQALEKHQHNTSAAGGNRTARPIYPKEHEQQ
jgi:hypothetical protein